MNDFDGTLQRPGSPEDARGSRPVGMEDPGSGQALETEGSGAAHQPVGAEDASAAGQVNARPGTPPADTSAQDIVGEETGISEDQVLGREPLPGR